MKQAIAANVLLAVLMLTWGSVQGGAYGPAPDNRTFCQQGWGDDQKAIENGLFARVVEMAEGAENERELRDILENDPPVQELASALGVDVTVRTLQTGYCYLTPLICLWRVHSSEPGCSYNCIGLYGVGEISTDETDDCDPVVGCILFPNCLAICITIIPSGPPPVIW